MIGIQRRCRKMAENTMTVIVSCICSLFDNPNGSLCAEQNLYDTFRRKTKDIVVFCLQWLTGCI